MTRVQVSLRISGTAPMSELIRLIQDVEAAGFDGAGILDSQLLCRDTFVTMGLASAHTSTKRRHEGRGGNCNQCNDSHGTALLSTPFVSADPTNA